MKITEIPYRSIIAKRYQKYKNLEQKLREPTVISDSKKFIEYSREIAKIKKLANMYQQFLNLEKEVALLLHEVDVADSAEFREELELEIKEKVKLANKTGEELIALLVVRTKDDEAQCYIEIQGRAGGNEANIFAGDLFEMYLRFLNNKKWRTEIISESRSDSGGFSEILFAIREKNAYELFCNEAGIHRVQRVPTTETKGRIHTSTARVIVLPIIETTNIKIKREDLEIQTFRASGAGGQHVNKTDSAVRIIHKPSGIVAVSQAGRSQHDNKENALKVIAARLKDAELQKEHEAKKTIYRAAGRGSRSEKIRTYNYPQNRVTDHRLEKSWLKLDRIMLGDINEILDELIKWSQKRKLADLAINEV